MHEKQPYKKGSVKQQYGVKAERVPQPLNNADVLTYLNEDTVSQEDLILLFRDMGLGDKLVTKAIAKGMKQGLEQLARTSEAAFQRGVSLYLDLKESQPKKSEYLH